MTGFMDRGKFCANDGNEEDGAMKKTQQKVIHTPKSFEI
jgi:hypothetical protein